jgi:hypothetical protein
MTVPASTRTALLALHRALLEGERRDYEKAHGRMNGGDFLQALIQDPAFAWLAPLTRLIATLDDVEDTASVLASIRDLLSLRPEGSELQRRYAERIDRDPDLAFAHGIALVELRSRGGSGPGVAAEERLARSDPARELEL